MSTATAIAQTVIARLGQRIAASGLQGRALVRQLWRSGDSYSQHVRRRIDLREIRDADELAERTLATLATATLAQVALPTTTRYATIQFYVEANGWVVIVNDEGRIVTSYPLDPAAAGSSFGMRNSAAPSMTTFSPPMIEASLHRYAIDIDTWFPEVAETAMTLASRERLHAARAQLTAEQRSRLTQADAQAVALYHRHRGAADPFHDIAGLGAVVALIESERPAAAA